MSGEPISGSDEQLSGTGGDASSKTELNNLAAASCDFHEPYFGANYPDACCIEGMLWDLDSCDEPGGPLGSGGEVPCPQCNHENWLDQFEDELGDDGYTAAEAGAPRIYTHKKVRHEKPEDEANMRGWWEAGWDQAKAEAQKP